MDEIDPALLTEEQLREEIGRMRSDGKTVAGKLGEMEGRMEAMKQQMEEMLEQQGEDKGNDGDDEDDEPRRKRRRNGTTRILTANGLVRSAVQDDAIVHIRVTYNS